MGSMAWRRQAPAEKGFLLCIRTDKHDAINGCLFVLLDEDKGVKEGIFLTEYILTSQGLV